MISEVSERSSWFLNVPLAEVGGYAAVTAAVQDSRVWRHGGAVSL